MTPPPSSLQSHQNEALQAQIVALGDRMDQGFNKLEKILSGFEDRVRGLENREAGCQPLINQRLDAAWRKIDELALVYTEMAKENARQAIVIEGFRNRLALIQWVGGIIGAGVVGWIVAGLLRLLQ